jgi:DNA-binding XRE family transcriptional regulator
MKLPEYKKRFGVQYKYIAKRCNCTPEAISMIATGKMRPSFKLAVKIEKATDGRVSHENWYPRPFIYRKVSAVFNGVSV